MVGWGISQLSYVLLSTVPHLTSKGQKKVQECGKHWPLAILRGSKLAAVCRSVGPQSVIRLDQSAVIRQSEGP